ncbi:MAG: TolC family protein [Planctomyces sp.]|nr:TolC family protein [Planctomyces sp.]
MRFVRLPRISNSNAPFRTRLRTIWKLARVSVLGLSVVLSGCSTSQKTPIKDLQYLTEGGNDYYRGRSTAIEYPCLDNETAKAVQETIEPRNLGRRIDDKVREITLSEAIITALSHNEVIETSALGGVGTKAVLTNPAGVSTVYDASIQETGVLFGRRGLDAALSDFDTTFASGITWGRDQRRVNLAGVPGIAAETAAFRSSLTKSFATGGSVQLSNDWDYLGTNASGTQFPSAYNGGIGASIRQPLLAGSGVDFTRVAGPVNPAFGAIAGVSQGVVIARINQDITLADFEVSVRTAVQDIENAYWDLHLAYRNYDTASTAYKAAHETLRVEAAKSEVGAGSPVTLPLVTDRYYETMANAQLALNSLYRQESELRRLIGLPMNDGEVLRPSDEPCVAEFVPDWKASLFTGMTERVELRQQKWQIKSLQLQLEAARSLVRPRLDAVTSYDVNGFGDRLIGQNTFDPATGAPVGNAFGSMTHDDLESWTMGLQFSMPIGFRQARSQVRNYELQLARANAILASQEKNIAHDITIAIQDVSSSYRASQSLARRYEAADKRAEVYGIRWDLGGASTGPAEPDRPEFRVQAQANAATAENAYYEQVIRYNKAITALHVATGDLLRERSIYLQEGRWSPEAYDAANRRALERRHAIDNPHLNSKPSEFVSPGPAGTVELNTVSSSKVLSEVPEPPSDSDSEVPSAVPPESEKSGKPDYEE